MGSIEVDLDVSRGRRLCRRLNVEPAVLSEETLRFAGRRGLVRRRVATIAVASALLVLLAYGIGADSLDDATAHQRRTDATGEVLLVLGVAVLTLAAIALSNWFERRQGRRLGTRVSRLDEPTFSRLLGGVATAVIGAVLALGLLIIAVLWALGVGGWLLAGYAVCLLVGAIAGVLGTQRARRRGAIAYDDESLMIDERMRNAEARMSWFPLLYAPAACSNSIQLISAAHHDVALALSLLSTMGLASFGGLLMQTRVGPPPKFRHPWVTYR